MVCFILQYLNNTHSAFGIFWDLNSPHQSPQLAAHPCTVPSHSAMCQAGGPSGKVPPNVGT